jgi:hypothetical protein
MQYYRNPRADVSWAASELHKSGAAGAHRTRCSLAGNIPHPIYADVDSEDLDGRADHLEKVFAALHVYLTAVIADTAHNIPGGTLDRRYLDNLFRDLSADAVGVIRNAAEEMREHENWRAS